MPSNDAEQTRLDQDARREKNWKRWGPYLAERQWGTVREDYSADGSAWSYFPHDHAASRAYRWGDRRFPAADLRQCRLCFALALWNTRDPILKERLFGLSGPEGNHGEDVKECYFYLDSAPTHSYMKALYKYPHAEFPYQWLVEEGARRSRTDPPPTIIETGIFDDSRYFDVFAEYAKGGPNDILVQITIANRGPDAAEIYLLPTIWFRNTWIWGCRHEGCSLKPTIVKAGAAALATSHETLGRFQVAFGPTHDGAAPQLLFTENETNTKQLHGVDQYTPYVKDAFHRYLIDGQTEAVAPSGKGTKAAAVYHLSIPAGEQRVVRTVFEGSNVDTPYQAVAFLGSVGDRETGAASHDLLAGLRSWPVQVAYFPLGSADEVPEYEVGFRIFSNGISDRLVLDYGDFTVSGALTRLEALAGSGC